MPSCCGSAATCTRLRRSLRRRSCARGAAWTASRGARAEAGDLQRALERAILDLPVKYRMPLVLRDVEGLSTAEAADIMDLGEAAFKSRLHRARLAVREAVEPFMGDEA